MPSKTIPRLFVAGLSIITLTLTNPALLFAISEQTLDFFDQNSIFYYDPDGTANYCDYSLGSYDGVASAGLSDLQSAFVDKYHDIAAELGQEYGIPWETVVAQGILESAAGTSNFAVNRNNFFGIGAFDSNPDNAFRYDTPYDGWRGYYENIKNTATYSAHGAFNYPGDPYGYAAAIKAAGYASDPNYVEKLSKLIAAIENRSTEKGWQSSAELAAASGHSPSSLSSTCTATPGNGDINATAIALAWPDRDHDKFDPKPEYKAALSAVGLDHYGEEWVNIGASCDAFVATVLRYSGVDENVVCCGAANMLNYFTSHPELYEEIENTGSSDNLQPGDIRSKPSHIEIYVQKPDGSFGIASASHADRTADYGASYYADESYRIFRKK